MKHSPVRGWACPNALGLEPECCGEQLPGGECACCAGTCAARVEMLNLTSWLCSIEQNRRRGLFLSWALTRADGLRLAVTTSHGATLTADGKDVEELALRFTAVLAAHVEQRFPPNVRH